MMQVHCCGRTQEREEFVRDRNRPRGVLLVFELNRV